MNLITLNEIEGGTQQRRRHRQHNGSNAGTQTKNVDDIIEIV